MFFHRSDAIIFVKDAQGFRALYQQCLFLGYPKCSIFSKKDAVLALSKYYSGTAGLISTCLSLPDFTAYKFIHPFVCKTLSNRENFALEYLLI